MDNSLSSSIDAQIQRVRGALNKYANQDCDEGGPKTVLLLSRCQGQLRREAVISSNLSPWELDDLYSLSVHGYYPIRIALSGKSKCQRSHRFF